MTKLSAKSDLAEALHYTINRREALTRFVTDGRGRFPTTKSLGRQLTGQINRYRGPFVLRNDQDKHSKVSTWCVEEWSG